jgi:hypothetical protein
LLLFILRVSCFNVKFYLFYILASRILEERVSKNGRGERKWLVIHISSPKIDIGVNGFVIERIVK